MHVCKKMERSALEVVAWPTVERIYSLPLHQDSSFIMHVYHPRDVLYCMLTRLAGYSMDPKISYDTYKLTWTPRVIKKIKKGRKRNAVNEIQSSDNKYPRYL